MQEGPRLGPDSVDGHQILATTVKTVLNNYTLDWLCCQPFGIVRFKRQLLSWLAHPLHLCSHTRVMSGPTPIAGALITHHLHDESPHQLVVVWPTGSETEPTSHSLIVVFKIDQILLIWWHTFFCYSDSHLITNPLYHSLCLTHCYTFRYTISIAYRVNVVNLQNGCQPEKKRSWL